MTANSEKEVGLGLWRWGFWFCFLFVLNRCRNRRLLKEEKEVYNESTDCVEDQFKKSFQYKTIGFTQLEETEWVAKNTFLMSKKLQEIRQSLLMRKAVSI